MPATLTTMCRHGVILALFAACCTLLIALVHQLTEQPIARQTQMRQTALFEQLLPDIHYDNPLTQSCYVVISPLLGAGKHHIYLAQQSDSPVAVIMQTTAPDGYSGAIQLLVAANFSGTILGVRVTEQHETPGLGDKIELRLTDWISHFAGKQIHGTHDPAWAVKKDGGEFDQFTGATITPRAVVNAVKRAGLYAESLPPQFNQLVACGDQP